MDKKFPVALGVMLAILTGRANALCVGVPCVGISITPSTVTWTNVADSHTQFLAADNSITVNGDIVTTPVFGSGSIQLSFPASVSGTQDPVHDVMQATTLTYTCSGSGNSGINSTPTYAAPKQQMGGTTPCATWGAGAQVTLNFNISFFLDDRLLSADSYSSPAAGYGVVYTAT